MIETITVSSRGQIVIPERIREELDIEEGMRLVLIQEDHKLILESETEFLKNFKELQERKQWISLGERAFAKTWDNAKDEETWSNYL
ncbi:AbrB/MazE/SpoVT family DNA-binding domain-containing protein [Candidatus Woesearchaeota archaeon]|nr:AbrB/MazE/SpoVT family DNA-binding domain-containing protein [Candidatus Woesearchaeota archaeon]